MAITIAPTAANSCGNEITLEQVQVLCDNMKKEQQAPHPANRGRVGCSSMMYR